MQPTQTEPNRSGHGWLLPAALLLCFSATGCSLVLSWDADRLPCDSDNECAEGYSCLVTECRKDHSLEKGETCSLPQQCAGDDFTCGSDPFTCRERCSPPYTTSTECANGEYCRPEINAPPEQSDGTCFPNECGVDADCDVGVCVRINSSAKACLQLCQPETSPLTGEYSDSCTGSGGLQQYCQVVGPSEELEFVCLHLPEGTPRAQPGSPCDPVKNPCARGAICIDQGTGGYECNSHCETPDQCVTPDTCCAVGDTGESVCTTC